MPTVVDFQSLLEFVCVNFTGIGWSISAMNLSFYLMLFLACQRLFSAMLMSLYLGLGVFWKLFVLILRGIF